AALVGLDRDRERRDAALGEQGGFDPGGNDRVLEDALLVVLHGRDILRFRKSAVLVGVERGEALVDFGIRERLHLADVAVAVTVERQEVGARSALGRLAGVLSPGSGAERQGQE